MRKTLIKSYLCIVFYLVFQIAAYGQAESVYYTSEKGFIPAQNDLTKVFLKLAASLEEEATPEPYIRHVLAEHARIDAKYEQATGKKRSARPAYFTDDYLNNLLTNWERLEKPLQLDQLCRDSGRYMRHAILGTWHKTPVDLVAEEKKLNEAEKLQYRAFVAKPFFKKSDLAALERFYEDGNGYDKLSKEGREQMFLRNELGMQSPEKREEYFANHTGGTVIVKIFNQYQRLLVADINADGERKVSSETLEKMLIESLFLDDKKPELSKLEWDEKDAVHYANLVKWEFERRWELARQNISEKGAASIEAQTRSMVSNLLILVHSELRAAMNENYLDRKTED